MGARYGLQTYSAYEAIYTSIQSTTYYIEPILDQILEVRINENASVVNNRILNQGHLMIFSIDPIGIDIDFELDSNGYLLLFATSNTIADQYDVDEMGHLIFTKSV
jgi:hypothetical protein